MRRTAAADALGLTEKQPLGAVSRSYNEFGNVLKKATAGIVAGKVSDQSILKASNLGFSERDLPPGLAYLVRDGRALKLKLPTI